ncbi:MAG: YerC/YecD family TrpR-related protein [Candidatus Saccharimonadales bacterium]
MNTYDMTIMENGLAQQLAESLASISDVSSMQAFLRDVMTEKEVAEISARLEAARMLAGGASYASIIKRTKLSSRTVARISDWLQNGAGGYKAVIETMHHTHLSPDLST